MRGDCRYALVGCVVLSMLVAALGRANGQEPPPLDLVYLSNPEGRMSVGSVVTLSGYLINNTDRAMLASVQLLANNDSRISPAGSLEYWLDPRGRSKDLSWTIRVVGTSPTAQPKMKIVHYEGDPISSGKRVVASTPLGVGQILQVLWDGKWYHGEVMSVFTDGRVKVHYVGWDSKWDEIVPRTRLQLANESFVAKHPESYVQTTRGDGECVAFVREAANVPAHSEWKEGIKVRGSNIPKGTAIATFVGGKYPDKKPDDGKSMHAAIYDGQDQNGIWVWDQWVGQAVSRRAIPFQAGRGRRSNDGDAFSVIERN
jgi:hypothetical protein